MATLKLLHILAVFVWVGSLLTLSRTLLFKDAAISRTTLLLKKLYLRVDLPAMACSVSLGLLSLTKWSSNLGCT